LAFVGYQFNHVLAGNESDRLIQGRRCRPSDARQATVRAAKARLCALAFLLAAGCSGAPTAFAPPIALGSKKGRQSIGIISAIGSKFAVQKVGTTVFGNEYNSVPVASWGIDDLVASKLAGLLGGNADVRRITYAKDAFASYEAPGALTGGSWRKLQTLALPSR